MEIVKTMAGVNYVYEDGRHRCWEMKSIWNPEEWLPCPEMEEAIVKAVNNGILETRREGRYMIFKDTQTGEDQFRRF